jgi:hypothetical protein
VLRDADLRALIDGAYAAATDASRWPVLLGRLSGPLGAHIGGLFVQDIATPSGAFSFSHGLSPEWLRLYRDYCAARNVPAQPAFLSSTPTSLTTDNIPRFLALLQRMSIPD